MLRDPMRGAAGEAGAPDPKRPLVYTSTTTTPTPNRATCCAKKKKYSVTNRSLQGHRIKMLLPFLFLKKSFCRADEISSRFFFERKLSSRFLNHIREMRQGTGCCSSDLASKLKHPKGQEPLCKSASRILLIPTQNQKESCAPHFDSVHLCS